MPPYLRLDPALSIDSEKFPGNYETFVLAVPPLAVVADGQYVRSSANNLLASQTAGDDDSVECLRSFCRPPFFLA